MPTGINPYFAIERITYARCGNDRPGTVYPNYKNGRGVCGLVLDVSGESEYLFADHTKKILHSGEVALFSDKCAYVITNCSETENFHHYTVNFELAHGYSFPFEKAYLMQEQTTALSERLALLVRYNGTGTVEGKSKVWPYCMTSFRRSLPTMLWSWWPSRTTKTCSMPSTSSKKITQRTSTSIFFRSNAT